MTLTLLSLSLATAVSNLLLSFFLYRKIKSLSHVHRNFFFHDGSGIERTSVEPDEPETYTEEELQAYVNMVMQ